MVNRCIFVNHTSSSFRLLFDSFKKWCVTIFSNNRGKVKVLMFSVVIYWFKWDQLKIKKKGGASSLVHNAYLTKSMSRSMCLFNNGISPTLCKTNHKAWKKILVCWSCIADHWCRLQFLHIFFRFAQITTKGLMNRILGQSLQ